MTKKGIGKFYKDFVSSCATAPYTANDKNSDMLIMTTNKKLFTRLGYEDNRSKEQKEKDMNTINMFKTQLAKELATNGVYNHAIMFTKTINDERNVETVVFAKDINDIHGVLCRCVDNSMFYDGGIARLNWRGVVGGLEFKTEDINVMSDVETAKYRITQTISSKLDEKYMEFVAYDDASIEEHFRG
ncbi:MAG: hypothetical protein E7361_02140 [Clostridiales bacterium]|nr:hypothetical protein [Clostridiales bacterium]